MGCSHIMSKLNLRVSGPTMTWLQLDPRSFVKTWYDPVPPCAYHSAFFQTPPSSEMVSICITHPNHPPLAADVICEQPLKIYLGMWVRFAIDSTKTQRENIPSCFGCWSDTGFSLSKNIFLPAKLAPYVVKSFWRSWLSAADNNLYKYVFTANEFVNALWT